MVFLKSNALTSEFLTSHHFGISLYMSDIDRRSLLPEYYDGQGLGNWQFKKLHEEERGYENIDRA